MTTLEDLLSREGFERLKQKTKPVSRGRTSGASASASPNRRFGLSVPTILPVTTKSNAELRRSVSEIPKNSVITDHVPGKVTRRGYGEQFLYAQEPKVLAQKKYESRGSFAQKQLDVKFLSRNLSGSKDTYSWGMERKYGYDKFYKNNLFEHEQNSCESQHLQIRPDAKDGCPVFTMDEAALKSIILVIGSCADRLLKDEIFRSVVHQECVSSLNADEVESKQVKGVLCTLKNAIMSIERMITDGPNQLELKKASLSLTMITGLKKLESEDGYPCTLISYLSGCAHLYLSIAYKMQKKGRISAKHLLQVFCDSPNQARTKLLPELWIYLFFPHLSHLKEWYEKEAESVRRTSEMTMKLEVLDRVYNNLLDGGTFQFAAYYKGCLMDDNPAPIFPCILVPMVSFLEIAEEDANEVVSVESHSLCNSVISKSMINKGLYESVLGQENRITIADIMISGEEEEKDEVNDETEQLQSEFWSNKYDDSSQSDEGTESHSPNSGLYAAETSHEYFSACSHDLGATFEENNQSYDRSSGSSSSSIIGMKDMKAESEMVQPWHYIKDYIHVGKGDQQENNNNPRMKNPAEIVSQMQAISESSDADTYYPMQSNDFLLYNLHPNELTGVTHAKSFNCETGITHRLLQENCSAMVFGYNNDSNQASFTGVPKVFTCLLTGLIIREPVTLESGYTFELAAIKKRFDLGIKTCPVTGQSLTCSTMPESNIVFKHLINEWVSECFRYCPSATTKIVTNLKNELAFSIFDQLLSGFSSEDKKANVKYLIALGGLQFLIQVFESGNLEEKSRATELLVQCIQADGYYRKYLAMNIRKLSLLELIHDGQIHEKTNVVSLLIELICLNSRMDITTFLSGLRTEASGNTMSDLLVCLKNALPEERVFVAVLILHLDIMEDPHRYSSFSDEAVKCIIATLECCLSNNKFIPNCRAALFMLGGYFSISGEILTELWLLKQAGFCGYSLVSKDLEEEEVKRKDWLRSITLVLVRYKKKSFIETLSKCWKMGCPELARICLVTTAWLSLALPYLSIPAIQISASLTLLQRLKESFRGNLDLRQRVLACLCLSNFSKIPECRSSLKETIEEIHDPLSSLQEVTWTARDLYNDFFVQTQS